MFDVNAGENGGVVSGGAYRVLLQIALLGIEVGEAPSAVLISQSLAELRPDLPHAEIVISMHEFSSGKREPGIQRLQEILFKFPDSQLGKAMLAVCLEIVGRPGWQNLMESVIQDGSDEYAVGLACAILGRSPPESSAAKNSGSPDDGNIPVNAVWG